MDDSFSITLSILGVLLFVAGGCLILGRRRVARNMRDARVARLSVKGVLLLGVFQMTLGAVSFAAAWTLPGRAASQRHSRAIQRLFELLDLSGGMVWVWVLIAGLLALVFGVRTFVSFARSTRDRDQSNVQLSPSDLRHIYLATILCALGVLALWSGVLMLLGG